MDEIRENMIKERNLRPSTIKTYLANLNKLHKKIYDKDIVNLDFLLKYDTIIDTLADYKLSTQKTYLASIVVALDSAKKDKYDKVLVKYRELMIDNIKNYEEDIKEQKKSETQNKNWVSMKALKKVISTYKKELLSKGVFSKTDGLNNKERDLLQKWLVGSLYVIDNENPPLRNDFAPMLIINLTDYNKLSKSDVETKNYLVNQSRNKKFFSFGEYKTKKTYGIKKIKLGSKLNSVLNLYLKLHKNPNLLLNNRGEPLTANGLTKYIQKVFAPTGKTISANLLRHIYISEYLTGPTLKEKEELGEKMGHNVSTQELYKKN